MMEYMKTCCRDCADRKYACHTTCKRYAAMRREADEIKIKILLSRQMPRLKDVRNLYGRG